MALKTAAGLHVRDLTSQPRARKIAFDLLKVLIWIIRCQQDSDAILKTVIGFKKDNGVLLKKTRAFVSVCNVLHGDRH